MIATNFLSYFKFDYYDFLKYNSIDLGTLFSLDSFNHMIQAKFT